MRSAKNLAHDCLPFLKKVAFKQRLTERGRGVRRLDIIRETKCLCIAIVAKQQCRLNCFTNLEWNVSLRIYLASAARVDTATGYNHRD